MRTTIILGSPSVLIDKTVPSAGAVISFSLNSALRSGLRKKNNTKIAKTIQREDRGIKIQPKINIPITKRTTATAKIFNVNLVPCGKTVVTQEKVFFKVIIKSSNILPPKKIAASCGGN